MNTISNITGGSAVSRLMSDDQDQCIALWRVRPFDQWPKLDNPVKPFRTIAVLDTETTGLNPKRDTVIEIGVAFCEIDALDRIVRITGTGQSFNDPGHPLTPEIQALTGLTDTMLQGQKINVDHVTKRLNAVSAIVAHNCSHDRPFVEALLPSLEDKPWICSMSDADWGAWGYDGRKQDHLLMQAGLFNPVKHRALSDVLSLVNLLVQATPTGGLVLAECMARAQEPTWRFEARGLPIDFKNVVKDRGWRWNGSVWWTEVADDEREAEEAWYACAFKPFRYLPSIEQITWETRYRR